MIRALYSAASGMTAQQMNVDNIAHNLANANTAGFKMRRAQFQDLMYQTMIQPGASASSQTVVPTGLQIGLGTRPSSNEIIFTQGNFSQTNNPLDIVIQGRGFFQIRRPSGELGYTRAGSFHLDKDGSMVTSDGDPLEPQITLPKDAQSITIAADGTVSYTQPGQTAAQVAGQIQLADFQNPAGLSGIGRNLYTPTDASGDPVTGLPGGQEGIGSLQQGFTEQSNVSVVEEFINLIVSQRAYEANSKVVKAADEMYQQVNNLSPMIALGLALALVSPVTAPSCVSLEGGQILARHVASVVSEFAALAPDQVLGIAPQPGVRRILSARELQRLASLHNVRLERDSEVCLEWKVEPVARARMLAAMRETLSDPAVHIEIVDLSRHPAPQGELTFPREGLVEPPPSQPKAAVYWKGYVRYAGQKRFEVWARVRVWFPSTRLVAAAALPPGSPVRADQIRSEPWEDFPYGSWLLRRADQAVGRVPKRPIRAGAYLDSSLLGKPKEILKGDLIRVEVRAGAARIATEAVAESDAGTGDVVLVRNRATGKKFPAKAAGHGLATIELRGAFAN